MEVLKKLMVFVAVFSMIMFTPAFTTSLSAEEVEEPEKVEEFIDEETEVKEYTVEDTEDEDDDDGSVAANEDDDDDDDDDDED